MDEQVREEIASLVAERRQLDKEYQEIKQAEKEAFIRCKKKSVEIEKKLSNLCEHEWVRDNYLYAELYCKICYIDKHTAKRNKSLDNKRSQKQSC